MMKPFGLTLACITLLLAAATFPVQADDQGRELTPLQMLEAVGPDIRARAVALLKEGKTDAAIADLAASTTLNDEEAAFVARMLDFEWKKRAQLDALTDKVMAGLDQPQQQRILTFLVNRQRPPALEALQAATGMPARDLTPVIATLERRLAAAGYLKGPTGSTPPDEVMAGLKPATRDQILRLIADGKKIQAIKELRAATGLGLKDSKDVIEAVTAGK